MTKDLRKKLDFIPLIILFITALYLVYSYFTSDILFIWKHYVGFCMLSITTLLFLKNHKLGILSLGITLILGLFSLLSFSPAITTIYAGVSKIDLIRFQPMFVLWSVIHFILSGRYYVGIANSKYWNNLKSDEPFKIT